MADLWLMHHTLLITRKYTSFSLKKSEAWRFAEYSLSWVFIVIMFQHHM